MKKIIILSLIIAAFQSEVQAQKVSITSVKANGIIETPGDVNLSGTTVVLDNSTIKCNTITIDGDVANLKIIGNVKLICKDFTLTAPAAARQLKIEMGSSAGTLTVEFYGTYVDNGRSFNISNLATLNLNFIKK